MVKNLPARAGDMKHGFDPWVREILWRRAWTEEMTKSHGQRSLVGYSPYSSTESDMIEAT